MVGKLAGTIEGKNMTGQRQQEANILKAHYHAAKARDPDLRYKTLADGMGVAQSAVAGWMNAHARCPDASLMWLSERMGFDPATVRPNIQHRLDSVVSEDKARKKAHELIDSAPERKLEEIINFIRFLLQTRR